MITDHPEFLTTRQTSKLLGVALTTIQLWVESGVLPAWKTAGGHRRIPRKAVDSLLAQRMAATEAPQGIVLVVEDDPVERELYRRQFAEWRLPVTLLLAENGFEGLTLAGRHAPDLVVADLSMPGMDGFKMIEQLRLDYAGKARAVIIVTGLSRAEIEARGGLPPDIPIYPKPTPFAALRMVVQHHALKRNRAEQWELKK